MRAQDFGIVMEDTAITHLSFSREYTAAVEAKQVRVSAPHWHNKSSNIGTLGIPERARE